MDGCVKLWDQDGKQILCAEYQRGKKHGVRCFLQNGVPWLIQECDKGQPQGEYLVKWTENGPRVLSMAERTDDDNEEMSKASQQLADLEQKMKNNEKELKKKLANWVAGSQTRENSIACSIKYMAATPPRPPSRMPSGGVPS